MSPSLASELDRLFVFILAGGSGERFWPLSRREQPKHLLHLLGEKTLLEETVLRLEGIVPKERLFVLTNSSQVAAVRHTLSAVLPASQVVAEPDKRDTAPAAALATAIALTKREDALVALLPADAKIHNTAVFQQQFVDAAWIAAKHPGFVTIAIRPTYPATGFGYLELGAQFTSAPQGSRVLSVQRFVEKPTLEIAQSYLRAGYFAWNAGIFLWQAETFLQESAKLCPPLASFITEFPSGDPSEFLQTRFPQLPKISIDYALMEKATRVSAVKAEFDWDDVGSWTALPAHLGRDPEGNCLRGSTAISDSRNNIVIAQKRTVVLVGVEGLVVVETDDAVLICHQNAVQEIKKIHPLLPEDLL